MKNMLNNLSTQGGLIIFDRVPIPPGAIATIKLMDDPKDFDLRSEGGFYPDGWGDWGD